MNDADNRLNKVLVTNPPNIPPKKFEMTLEIKICEWIISVLKWYVLGIKKYKMIKDVIAKITLEKKRFVTIKEPKKADKLPTRIIRE